MSILANFQRSSGPSPAGASLINDLGGKKMITIQNTLPLVIKIRKKILAIRDSKELENQPEIQEKLLQAYFDVGELRLRLKYMVIN